MAELLDDKIKVLRDPDADELRQLKNYQRCSRMEVLVKSVEELQDTVPAFESMFPKGTLAWFQVRWRGVAGSFNLSTVFLAMPTLPRLLTTITLSLILPVLLPLPRIHTVSERFP